MAVAVRPPNTQQKDPMKPVYCSNKRCNNGRPIGKAMLGPGSAGSWPCRVCGQRTVKVGATTPHWA